MTNQNLTPPPPLRIREATKKGFTEIKDGECFDAEHPTSKTRRGRKMTEKSNTLTAQTKTEFCRYKNARIRRLTPTECARLQTIPEWYKFRMIDPKTGADKPVSETQIYRVLGNGWTCKIISFFWSHLPKHLIDKE